jgi:hypothetical protein
MINAEQYLQAILSNRERWQPGHTLPILQAHRHVRAFFKIDNGSDTVRRYQLGSADPPHRLDSTGSLGSRNCASPSL